MSKSHGTKQVSGINSIYTSVSVLLCSAIKSKNKYCPLDEVQNLGMKGENSYTETLAKIQVGAIFHMRARFVQVMKNLESHGM